METVVNMQDIAGAKTDILLITLTVSALLVAGMAAAILLTWRRSRMLGKHLKEQDSLIQDLTKMYNKAIEYDKNKSEFFTNITHELRTPLSVILGALQLMEQKETAFPKQLDVMKQNCFRMMRLINNILDLSKADSGFSVINEHDTDLVGFTADLVASVAPFAEKKGVKLIFETRQDKLVTSVDTDKMEKVLLNLLSNAIKFTPSGGTVSVNINKRPNSAEISVSDTGPGIPPEKQLEIFERFKQVGSKATKASEGSGIGLSLVKTFVELMGGDIKLKSIVGRGSEFIVELPLKERQQNNAEPLTELKVRNSEPVRIEFSGLQ